MLGEANTFLENNKMVSIIFNYIFGLTPFSKRKWALENGLWKVSPNM